VELNRRALMALTVTAGAAAALEAKAQSLGEMWPRPDPDDPGRWLYLRPPEAAFLIAATDRLIPEDEFPSASQAGVVDYIDLQLASDWGKGEGLYLEGPFRPQEATKTQGYQLRFTPAELFRHAIGALAEMLDTPFEEMSGADQDRVLKRLENGQSDDSAGDTGQASGAGGGSDGAKGTLMLGEVPAATFFEHLMQCANEGYFADPIHGGNFEMVGWRMVGFPGAHAYHTDGVDRHGMDYFRPSAGVASAASGTAKTGAASGSGPERARFTRGTR